MQYLAVSVAETPRRWAYSQAVVLWLDCGNWQTETQRQTDGCDCG